MSSQATDLFLQSLKRCLLVVPAFLDDFYDRFVGSSEEVREKFRGVDICSGRSACSKIPSMWLPWRRRVKKEVML